MSPWGPNPGLKVMALGDYDPGGVVGRFQQAADHLGGPAIRSAHRTEAYFRFPRDLLWAPGTEKLVQQLAREADVLHLNNTHAPLGRIAAGAKPTLMHHHGSRFRRAPAGLLDAARKGHWVQAVSTVDLLRHAPNLHWLPTAYDVDQLGAFGAAHAREPDGRIRVVSAPTSRVTKSTEALIAACARLKAEGLPVDLVLVEGKRWDECVAVKATADIYFDQVGLGYGCNAIESWAMGIPVIAGADAWTLAKMTELFGKLPFYPATEATIADAIRALATSKRLRTQYANRGLAHARRFHAEEPALARLVELYAEAVRVFRPARAGKAAAAPAVAARTTGAAVFTCPYPRLAIPVGRRRVRFVNGRAVIHDPATAAHMRLIAHSRPRYQITELTD